MVDEERINKIVELQKLEEELWHNTSELIKDDVKDFELFKHKVIGFIYEGNKTYVTVYNVEGTIDGQVKNFMISNPHLWHYIVNNVYFAHPKSVNFDTDIQQFYEKIDIKEETKMKISEIYSNKELEELHNFFTKKEGE